MWSELLAWAWVPSTLLALRFYWLAYTHLTTAAAEQGDLRLRHLQYAALMLPAGGAFMVLALHVAFGYLHTLAVSLWTAVPFAYWGAVRSPPKRVGESGAICAPNPKPRRR